MAATGPSRGTVSPIRAIRPVMTGVARAPSWFLGSGLKLAVAGVFGVLFVTYVALLGGKEARA